MSFVPPGAHVTQYFRLLYTFSVQLDVIIKYKLSDYGVEPASFDLFQPKVIYGNVVKIFQETGLPITLEESICRSLQDWIFDATPYCDSEYHDGVYGYTAVGIEKPVLKFSKSSGFDSF
jgi:hypothetical protein